MPALSRLALVIVPLAMMLGSRTANASFAPTQTTYDFAGNCSDCQGIATAELTLSNYVLGQSITKSNFISFHYDGTNLLAPFTISAADLPNVYGSIVAPLPAPETFAITTSFAAFFSSNDGPWCAGPGSCASDMGPTHLWSAALPVASVPEPMSLALLAGGLLCFALMRRGRA